MPRVVTHALHQTAVLWPRDGTDAAGEVKVSGDYLEIPVRWENRRNEVLLPDGTPIAVDATAVTDRDIEVGSLMWLGDAEDLAGTGGPGEVDGATAFGLMQVIYFDWVPDIKGRTVYREAGMIHYRGSMPTQT